MSMGNATENITARLAEWAAQVKYEDLPRRVVEEAKNQTLSVLASVHAGHFTDIGRVVSRTVKDWGGGKDATMIPSGERTSLHHALFANTALSMTLDYDDYLFGGHVGHSAVLVPLALSEKIAISGKEFIVAQVVANELGGRLGASVLAGPLNGQTWSFVHLIAAAVSSARLLGGNAEQIQSAIGLALTQPNRPLWPAFFGSDGKALLASTTTTAGVQAAQLAVAGMRCTLDVIGGEQGFVNTFSPQPLMGAFNGLGKTWLTETLSYKIYPGCAYLGSVIDCVLSMQRQHQIDAKKVKAVHVATGPLTAAMEAMVAPYLHGADTPAPTLNFTIGYNVAAVLIDKELTARQFQKERIRDAATWALAARVQVVVDDAMGQRLHERSPLKIFSEGNGPRMHLDLGAVDLMSFRMAFASRVRIEMEDGRSFEMEQEVPIGAAGRPFDERRRCCEDKFRRETRYTLRKEKIDKAVDTILHVDQANSASLREIVRLCCSERI